MNYVSLFDADIIKIIEFFQRRFIEIQAKLKSLRHGVVHNDVNDNNIIVTEDLVEPTVKAIIDYGDAINFDNGNRVIYFMCHTSSKLTN